MAISSAYLLSAMAGPNPIPEKFVIDWVPGLSDVANAIREAFSGIADFFKNITNTVIDVLSGLANAIRGIISFIRDLATSGIATIIQILKDIIREIFDLISEPINSAIKTIEDSVKDFEEKLRGFVAPWLVHTGTRFLRASTNALLSYYSLRTMENAVKSWASGKIDFRTLIGRLIMAPILGVTGAYLAQAMITPAIGTAQPTFAPPTYVVPTVPSPKVKTYDVTLVEEAGTVLW